jgi:hypothetical protein
LDHLTLPIDALRSEAAFFLRAKDLRLLHVAADPLLHAHALATLAALEFAPDSTTAVVTVAHESDGSGGTVWTAARNALRAAYARAREGFAKTGINLVELPEPHAETEPLTQFARDLVGILEALTAPPAPTRELLCAWCPAGAETTKATLREFNLLLRTKQLATVRWAWLESGKGLGGAALCREFGETAIHHECRIDRDLQRRELDDLLEAMANEDAVGLASAGAVFPRRRPPGHPDEPALVATVKAPPHHEPIKPFLNALRALRKGDAAGACALQRQARDAALARGVTPLAVDMDVMLSTFMAQALAADGSSLSPVLAMLQEAAVRAEQADLRLPAAKVLLVLAGFARVTGDFELLGSSLRRAANHAKDAGVPALAVEALRQAAEALVKGKRDHAAEKLLYEALEQVEKLPLVEARATGAAECVRMLADIFRRRGLPGRAQELEHSHGGLLTGSGDEATLDLTGTEGD